MDELRPCPFCDEAPALTGGRSIVTISCDTCGYSFSWPRNAKWLKEWNTRPVEDALRAEVERLRAALEEIKRIHAQTWRYDTPIKTIEVLDKMVNVAYDALEVKP